MIMCSNIEDLEELLFEEVKPFLRKDRNEYGVEWWLLDDTVISEVFIYPQNDAPDGKKDFWLHIPWGPFEVSVKGLFGNIRTETTQTLTAKLIDIKMGSSMGCVECTFQINL